MGCGTKLWWAVFVFLGLSNMTNISVCAEPVVPCYFIFGDSLVDSGNNNAVETAAKANYWPYGIDFPKGPSGRFCNGRTVVDAIAEHLGFEDYIPPFATATGSEILKGVNYGSGAAGILDQTGHHQGNIINFNKQLNNHKITISSIASLLGSEEAARKHLNKCLYSVVMGSNDYINNYFLPKFYNTSEHYNPKEFSKFLINKYCDRLKTLYRYGARKVTLAGVGLVGCTPNATAYYGTNGSLCVDKMNEAVGLFNQKLIPLVNKLNAELTDAKFIVLNTMANGVAPIGWNMTNCCEVDDYGLCIHYKVPCNNRAVSIFWDAFHPTEVVNIIQANRSYHASVPSDAYPMDIYHLVGL